MAVRVMRVLGFSSLRLWRALVSSGLREGSGLRLPDPPPAERGARILEPPEPLALVNLD